MIKFILQMSTRPVRSSHSRPFSANRTTAPRTQADGKAYPEIKQRGYYSDIVGEGVADDRLGDVLTGPQMAQDLSWQVGVENHTPLASTYRHAEDEGPDGEKVHVSHGPTTENTAVSDFPKDGDRPKVQLPFFTPPGHCPRKIEIERRRREYSSQNLPTLLNKEGIETGLLMPKNNPVGLTQVKLNADPENPAPFPSYLPLDIFDNFESDCRTPDEWMAMGDENGMRKPLPGKALLPTRDDLRGLDPRDASIEYTWFDVGVLDYDEQSQHFYVQKMDSAGRIVDSKGNPVVNGGVNKEGARLTLPSQYWVPRVRVMFAAEDPQVFAKRVANAFRSRQETESMLRYNLYIDCMPMEGVGELDQASLKRMTEWAKGAPALAKDKGLDDYIQVLEKEVNIDFCRSMNR